MSKAARTASEAIKRKTLAELESGAAVAQQSAIGAILADAPAALAAGDEAGLDATCFTIPIWASAYRAAVELVAEGKPVDIASIVGMIDGDPEENAGDLRRAMTICRTAKNAKLHAEKIVEPIKRRRLSLMASNWIGAIEDGQDLDAVLLEIRSAVEDAGREKTTGGPLVATFPPLRFSYLRDLVLNPEDHHVLGNGWLRRGAWTLVTGGTGIGKSVLVEQLAAFLACGKHVFGLSVSRPFKVLLLTAEDDEETLRRNLVAIAENLGLDPATLDANLQIHHAYALDGVELVVAIDDELKRGAFDLVILDNYQAYSGAFDMNDSAAWKTFITPLSKILKERKAAMLLVDHTGKPQERKGWGRHDSVYLAAGTSRKANGARCSAELYSPADGDERYRLHFGKNAERAGVVDAQGRMVRDVYLDRSHDATRPYWTPSADQNQPRPLMKGETEVVAYATANPFLSIYKISEAVGVSKSQVANILKKHPILSKRASNED